MRKRRKNLDDYDYDPQEEYWDGEIDDEDDKTEYDEESEEEDYYDDYDNYDDDESLDDFDDVDDDASDDDEDDDEVSVEKKEEDAVSEEDMEKLLSESDISESDKYNELLIATFEQFQAGMISKDDLYKALYFNLINLVKYFYYRRYGATYGNRLFDDFCQEAMCAITNKATEFDLNKKTKPSTYFSYHIIAAFKAAYNREFNLTDYTRKMKKLEKIAEEQGYENVEDVPPAILRIASGYTLETINNTIKYSRVSVVSLDKKNDEGDDLSNVIPSYGNNPADLIIAKEKRDTLLANLRKLPRINQWVLIQHYVEGKSYNKIVRAFNKLSPDEKYDRFGSQVRPLSTKNIQYILNNSRRMLKHTDIQQVHDFDPEDFSTDYEQADDSDIEAFMLSDLTL